MGSDLGSGRTTRPAPKSNRADEGDFAYGSLIRKHHMDAAIKARPRRGWPGSSSRGLGFVGFQHGYRKLAISLRIPTT